MNTRTAFRSALLAMSALGALAAPGVAQAQGSTTSAEATHDFNVPAQPLARALSAIAEQADIQVVYPDKEPLSINAPAVRGRMSTSQALASALAGSGYSYRFLREGVVTLVSTEGNDGELVTGAVRVEGAQGSPYFGGAGVAAGVNGINGSRDITATEGTGSFTSGALTIGSKVPQALKDAPQSISVLTSERLEQQNVTDFTTAMKQLPGVTLVQGTTSLQTTFYSRGFEITSIQVDGGAPLSTWFVGSTDSAYFPLIDMAQYDHVELLRGASGLFNGFGNPSGTVNLVRKKPLDHAQFALEASVGSWSTNRLMLDASSPLAFDGKLRGRLVMSYHDNEYFYDTAEDRKTLIYGIAEFDATPDTLLTAGLSYNRQDSVPWSGGLPRYQTGGDLNLPRNTSFVFPWNRWEFDTTEIFGGIEQKLWEDWTAKLNVTYNRQSSTRKIGYSTGAVNPLTNAGPRLVGTYDDYSSKQLSAEFTLTGGFEIFGQRQEVTVGVNRSHNDGGGNLEYESLIYGTSSRPYLPYSGGLPYYYGSPNGETPPIDVFNFDPRDLKFSEPPQPRPSFKLADNGQIQTGAYINLRLTAFDRLHFTTGLRWSRYNSESKYGSVCSTVPTTGTPSAFNCVGKNVGDLYNIGSQYYSDTNISWPPTASLSYDVTKQLTAYLSYADIRQSLAGMLDQDLKPLDPITGSNIEAGMKWQSKDGGLNASLALFRINQRGFYRPDGNYDFNATAEDVANGIYYYWVAPNGRRVPMGLADPNHACCYKTDPNLTARSEGIDTELAGEMSAGWQISLGYTFNRNKQVGISFGAGEGLPFLTILPEHLYKLWTSYDFGAAGNSGWLAGLTISGGVNGQSSGYRAGSACSDLNPANSLGISTCKPDADVPYEFVVPAYAVFSARADYRFSDNWSAALNLENIFDKTYYQSTGFSVNSGHWYGSPRGVTATLRAKW